MTEDEYCAAVLAALATISTQLATMQPQTLNRHGNPVIINSYNPAADPTATNKALARVKALGLVP